VARPISRRCAREHLQQLKSGCATGNWHQDVPIERVSARAALVDFVGSAEAVLGLADILDVG